MVSTIHSYQQEIQASLGILHSLPLRIISLLVQQSMLQVGSCVNLRFYSLRVWHRQLSSSEITTLYNAGPSASTLSDINDYTMKFNTENAFLDSNNSKINVLTETSYYQVYLNEQGRPYFLLNSINELSGNFLDAYSIEKGGTYTIKIYLKNIH